ncbi:MAG: TIGR04283 family arsenosugar biosynthesis glycosyltransferase [Fulvivirga sp.]|nr:TIGR04283 family arsenosugar biosynthesis glycosyltransferase [Fulvivirga sp.]
MISVIIPTYNEEKYLGALLSDLNHSEAVSQVIVVDGGSTDETMAVARFSKAEVYSARKGRSHQMNFGAQKARNEFLLFLHADSRINHNGLLMALELMKAGEAGSFYLSFDSRNRLLRLYAYCSKLNHALFTYGDQGLFLSKSLFKDLNGFKAIPIMEDIDMVQRIKRLGKFSKLNYPLVSSPRRFERHGVVMQQLRNILLVLAYLLGVSPKYLARFYTY